MLYIYNIISLSHVSYNIIRLLNMPIHPCIHEPTSFSAWHIRSNHQTSIVAHPLIHLHPSITSIHLPFFFFSTATVIQTKAVHPDLSDKMCGNQWKVSGIFYGGALMLWCWYACVTLMAKLMRWYCGLWHYIIDRLLFLQLAELSEVKWPEFLSFSHRGVMHS